MHRQRIGSQRNHAADTIRHFRFLQKPQTPLHPLIRPLFQMIDPHRIVDLFGAIHADPDAYLMLEE